MEQHNTEHLIISNEITVKHIILKRGSTFSNMIFSSIPRHAICIKREERRRYPSLATISSALDKLKKIRKYSGEDDKRREKMIREERR